MSDNETYRALVAEFGPCTCSTTGLCSEAVDSDNPGVPFCPLCQHLDPEWPCPTLDDDAGDVYRVPR